jgi:hypothetical protein
LLDARSWLRRNHGRACLSPAIRGRRESAVRGQIRHASLDGYPLGQGRGGADDPAA